MPEDIIDPPIERVLAAFDSQDADGAVAEFAEDGTFVEAPREEVFSRAEFREYLADVVFELFPDYSVEEKQVLTTYDWATAVEWSFRATHEGSPREEVPPTGNTVTLPIVSIVTVADDGITSWRDYWDRQSLDAQLGRE